LQLQIIFKKKGKPEIHEVTEAAPQRLSVPGSVIELWLMWACYFVNKAYEQEDKPEIH